MAVWRASTYPCVSQALQMQKLADLKELHAESAYIYWRFCRAKFSASCYLTYRSTEPETTQQNIHPMWYNEGRDTLKALLELARSSWTQAGSAQNHGTTVLYCPCNLGFSRNHVILAPYLPGYWRVTCLHDIFHILFPSECHSYFGYLMRKK